MGDKRILCAVAIGCSIAWEAAPARAGAELRGLLTAPGLEEVAATTRVTFDGVVARVQSTHVIANRSQSTRQILYTFELPKEAALVGARVRLASGKTVRGHIVRAAAALRSVADPDKVRGAPDAMLLRAVLFRGPLTRYELRVYPLPAQKRVTVTLQWLAPLRFGQGRLSLRIPGRGAQTNLARGRLELLLRAPAGLRGFGEIHAAGVRLARRAGASARFKTPFPAAGDLVIEAAPIIGKAPSLHMAAVPLGPKLGALGLAVLMPTPRGGGKLLYERVLFVVDASRSMGQKGLDAARTIIESAVKLIPGDSSIEAIAFDHEAKEVLGGLRKNKHANQQSLLTGLVRPSLRNGSDMGAALDAVRGLLAANELPRLPPRGVIRGNRAPTLIVILSDDMTPTELTARRASDRIGSDAMQNAEVVSVVLVPDSAPVPDLEPSALTHVARQTKGRILALRYGEAQNGARRIASALNSPAPLRSIALRAPAGTSMHFIDIPNRFPSGGGILRFGVWRGRKPSRVILAAQAGNDNRRLVFRSTSRPLAAAARPLALARLGPQVFSPDRDVDAPAAEALWVASKKWPLVSDRSSLVGLIPDGFGRARLAMAARWGSSLFRRLPPPPEREPDHQFQPVVRIPQVNIRSSRLTGSLDRVMVRRLIRTYVLPRARACYQKALAGNSKLQGSMTVYLEIVRGEVQIAGARNSSFASSLNECVTEAAYTIQVPKVRLGNDPEQIAVVRYPLSFRVVGKRGRVGRGAGKRRTRTILDGPLGGLPDRDPE